MIVNNILTNLPVLQVVITLLAAPLTVIFPSKRLSWIITFISCLLIVVVSLFLAQKVLIDGQTLYYQMGNWSRLFGIEYKIDALSIVILLIISITSFFSIIYAPQDLNVEVDKKKHYYFYGVFLLVITGLLGITATNDIFNLYVFLEITSLASYALIAMGNNKHAPLAAFEYLILGTIGASFFLIGVGFAYGATGTLNISELYIRIKDLEQSKSIITSFGFIMTGLTLKIALFPLHIWLCRAYSYAPNVITVFLSATSTKVGLYVLIRMIFDVFGHNFVFEKLRLELVFNLFAIFAIIFGAVMAIMQKNIKMTLTYSSVSQIGYIILAVIIPNQHGITATIVYLVHHAFTKAALFMAVGYMFLYVGNNNINNFCGLYKKMPWTCAAFVICSMSLIGIPFTSGFVSKWMLVMALVNDKSYFSLFIVIVGSLITLMYIWKIIEKLYSSPDESSKQSQNQVNHLKKIYSMGFCLWCFTILIVFTGLYSKFLIALGDKVANIMYLIPN